MKILLCLSLILSAVAGVAIDPGYFLFIPASLVLMTPANLGVLQINLGTVGAGVGTATPFTLQYVPQMIRFVTTAAPGINLKIQGDATLIDLDAAGVAIIQTWRKLGAFTNEYCIVLANSLIKNRTITLTITNQTATAFALDGHSEITLPESQQAFIGYGSTQVLVGGSRLEKFAALFMPNMGATDTFNIWMNDSTQDTLTRDEIRARLQFTQNPVVTSTYIWDNVDGNTSTVQLLPAATQTIYWCKYFKTSEGKINTSIQQS